MRSSVAGRVCRMLGAVEGISLAREAGGTYEVEEEEEGNAAAHANVQRLLPLARAIVAVSIETYAIHGHFLREVCWRRGRVWRLAGSVEGGKEEKRDFGVLSFL